MSDNPKTIVVGRPATDPTAKLMPLAIPGSKLYPCHKCGVQVWLSPRSQLLVDGGQAEPCCMLCIPKEDVVFTTPTPEEMVEDITGVTPTRKVH